MSFTQQQGLQTFLLLLGLACVPWMLLVKPILLRAKHKGRTNVSNGLIFTEILSKMNLGQSTHFVINMFRCDIFYHHINMKLEECL